MVLLVLGVALVLNFFQQQVQQDLLVVLMAEAGLGQVATERHLAQLAALAHKASSSFPTHQQALLKQSV
jgi:hypothetical protein